MHASLRKMMRNSAAVSTQSHADDLSICGLEYPVPRRIVPRALYSSTNQWTGMPPARMDTYAGGEVIRPAAVGLALDLADAQPQLQTPPPASICSGSPLPSTTPWLNDPRFSRRSPARLPATMVSFSAIAESSGCTRVEDYNW